MVPRNGAARTKKFREEEKVSKQKKIGIAAVLAVVLVAMVLLVFWMATDFVYVGMRAYPKKAEFLNLESRDITVEQYEALRAELPECELYWNVPFQGKSYPEGTEVLKISGITPEDAEILKYFPQLKIMDARGCTDYEMLMQVQAMYPECVVCYLVEIDGQDYPQDAAELTVAHLTEEDIAAMDYLPQVKSVSGETCKDYDLLLNLRQKHPRWNVNYNVEICGKTYAFDTEKLEFEDTNPAEFADMLKYLPNLKSVFLMNPIGGAENLLALKNDNTGVDVSWSVNVLGLQLESDATEVDFSDIPLETVEPVAQEMAYFPDAEKVIMSNCGIENEEMARFREEKRADYKVVWTVMCGPIATRTDETSFMPSRVKQYYFIDEYAENLRYCEDMICIDLGHRYIHWIDFVTYMPHLKYFIVTDTRVVDITPISTCKELVYLEIDMTHIKDYEPLLGCTALEDLNLGLTKGDPEIIGQMTGLKHLWWGGGKKYAAELKEKLPNTYIRLAGRAVGDDWRKTQNYYDMRDALGMYYMN